MSKIEWTDKTWNPVTGCDKVSQGCKHCYAEVMHKRLMKIVPEKYSKPFLGNIQIHHDELNTPKQWKKSTVIFVNSMSDLFHKDVPMDFLLNVFWTMQDCSQHIFQILTKRPENAYHFLVHRWNVICPVKLLPNVIIGCSVEDQTTYNERAQWIGRIKAMGWKTMLSAEPLLGTIDLHFLKDTFDWVITGGESGNRTTVRPTNPDWVRSLRDQCQAAGVPFFFKQWGSWAPNEKGTLMYRHKSKAICGNTLDGKQHMEFPTCGLSKPFNIKLKTN